MLSWEGLEDAGVGIVLAERVVEAAKRLEEAAEREEEAEWRVGGEDGFAEVALLDWTGMGLLEAVGG